nr:GNAT family N-acetyltransferase [Candidatus Accumulibacter contiguus]
MYDTRIITPEMHDEWFRRELKNEKSRHFMFKEKGRSVGFVSFTDINARDRRCTWAYNLSDERDSLQKGLGAVMEYFAIEHVFEKNAHREALLRGSGFQYCSGSPSSALWIHQGGISSKAYIQG